MMILICSKHHDNIDDMAAVIHDKWDYSQWFCDAESRRFIYIYVLAKVSTQIQVSGNALRILAAFFSGLDSPLLLGLPLSFELSKLVFPPICLSFTFFCAFFLLFGVLPGFLLEKATMPPPSTLRLSPTLLSPIPPSPLRKFTGRRWGLRFITMLFFPENNSPNRYYFGSLQAMNANTKAMKNCENVKKTKDGSS